MSGIKNLAFIVYDCLDSSQKVNYKLYAERISQTADFSLDQGVSCLSYIFSQRIDSAKLTVQLKRLDLPAPYRIIKGNLFPPYNNYPLINIAISFSEKVLLLEMWKAWSGEFSEELLKEALKKKGWEEPDLVILTSGKRMIGNFLTWSIAYSEIYFSLLPFEDFSSNELKAAFEDFSGRQRRFGRVP